MHDPPELALNSLISSKTLCGNHRTVDCLRGTLGLVIFTDRQGTATVHNAPLSLQTWTALTSLKHYGRLHLGYELFLKFSLSDIQADPVAAPLRGGLTLPLQAAPPPKAGCTPSAACPCSWPLQLHASGPRWPGLGSHLLLAAAMHCWGAVAAAVLRAALARGAGGVLPAPPTGDKNCLMDSCVAPAPAVASSACRFKAERGCACSMHHYPAQHSLMQLHPEAAA